MGFSITIVQKKNVVIVYKFQSKNILLNKKLAYGVPFLLASHYIFPTYCIHIFSYALCIVWLYSVVF